MILIHISNSLNLKHKCQKCSEMVKLKKNCNQFESNFVINVNRTHSKLNNSFQFAHTPI